MEYGYRLYKSLLENTRHRKNERAHFLQRFFCFEFGNEISVNFIFYYSGLIFCDFWMWIWDQGYAYAGWCNKKVFQRVLCSYERFILNTLQLNKYRFFTKYCLYFRSHTLVYGSQLIKPECFLLNLVIFLDILANYSSLKLLCINIVNVMSYKQHANNQKVATSSNKTLSILSTDDCQSFGVQVSVYYPVNEVSFKRHKLHF